MFTDEMVQAEYSLSTGSMPDLLERVCACVGACVCAQLKEKCFVILNLFCYVDQACS